MKELPKYAIDTTNSWILHSSKIQTRLRHTFLSIEKWFCEFQVCSLLHFMEIMTQRLPFIRLIPISSPHWQRAMKYLYIHRRLSFPLIKKIMKIVNLPSFASNAKISDRERSHNCILTDFEKLFYRSQSFAQTNFYSYIENIFSQFYHQKLNPFEGLAHAEN